MVATINTFADMTKTQTTRYVINADFTQAILFFEDDTYLQFEHSSRKNRWVKASVQHGTAHKFCQALQSFRLNAKHLQLYFSDGSNVEFFGPNPKSAP